MELQFWEMHGSIMAVDLNARVQGWESGAGMGVGILRGIPLLENKNVCWIPLFENRKLGRIYKMFISCF